MKLLKCRKCKQTFEEENFRRISGTKRGRAYSCIECEKEERRQRHLRNYQRKHPNSRAPENTRWCPSCEDYRALAEFSFSEKEGRFAGYCRDCGNTRRRESYRRTHAPKSMNAFAPPGRIWCPKCSEFKEKKEFYYDKKGRRSGYCRQCMCEYGRKTR